MKSKTAKTLTAIVVAVVCLAHSTPADAETALKNICRVKGQEENTLTGLGLVIGLQGTGDGGNYMPMVRGMALAMGMMGNPVGSSGLADLKDTENVALVIVTATVPSTGARQGDQLDCVISSIGSAKSLAGGRLFLTPLTGPLPQEPRPVYAVAEGPITLDDPELTTTARIHRGCRMEADFFNAYHLNNKITLVLDRDFADFQTAQSVAHLINEKFAFQNSLADLAWAIDAANIEVIIPPQYVEDAEQLVSPVDFVAQILETPMLDLQEGDTVVIHERSGSIVIGVDVEISPVAVAQKGMLIEAGNAGNQFVPIDTSNSDNPKLKSLVEALRAVQVPTEDIIDIIKALARNRSLHGRLIVK